MKNKETYYSDYLGLNSILKSQAPKSDIHEEMLFIITHQAFELWFKQIIYDFDSVIKDLNSDKIDDNKVTLSNMVAKLQRIIQIFKLMNQQFSILETMNPLDFLEFRDLLAPSSGLQSKQFKLIEAKMGLKSDNRHTKYFYKRAKTPKDVGGLREDDRREIDDSEKRYSLLSGLKKWLNRISYLDKELKEGENFIKCYLKIYSKYTEKMKVKEFKKIFIRSGSGEFTGKEMSSALFIMLYRNYPLLRKPFELIDSLIALDVQLYNWRSLHLSMVEKMIGFKTGTSGTNISHTKTVNESEGYLVGTLKNNFVFKDLTTLSTYYIKKDQLPKLPKGLIKELEYHI